MKRKFEGKVVLSDSDDAPPVAQSKPPSKTKTGPRIRKGVVLTDEEDLPRASRHKRTLASAAASEPESDTEPSLKAMMDVDDGMIIVFFSFGQIRNIVQTKSFEPLSHLPPSEKRRNRGKRRVIKTLIPIQCLQ